MGLFHFHLIYNFESEVGAELVNFSAVVVFIFPYLPFCITLISFILTQLLLLGLSMIQALYQF